MRLSRRGALRATSRERQHLEEAHAQLCTALTVLRTNVELVASQLDRDGDAAREQAKARLDEVSDAVDRLQGLAQLLKAWHGPRRR